MLFVASRGLDAELNLLNPTSSLKTAFIWVFISTLELLSIILPNINTGKERPSLEAEHFPEWMRLSLNNSQYSSGPLCMRAPNNKSKVSSTQLNLTVFMLK